MSDVTDSWKGPSIFPILFVAVLGQLMTVLASWKLESSISIGLLECLLASRSLASAFLALVKLRIFNLWVPVILVAWCLSPLGGQSALRIVYTTSSQSTTVVPMTYLDTENTPLIGIWANDYGSLGSVIDSTFVTGLASPGTSKNGSQDLYGNIQVPMLEAVTLPGEPDGWYELYPPEKPPHAALLGVPFKVVDSLAKSSFFMETNYKYMDCSAQMYSDAEFFRVNNTRTWAPTDPANF